MTIFQTQGFDQYPTGSGDHPDQVVQVAFDARLATLTAVAFMADMRLAVSIKGLRPVGHRPGFWEYDFDYIVLSPGEVPPRDRVWTIYENHSGRAVGRSA